MLWKKKTCTHTLFFFGGGGGNNCKFGYILDVFIAFKITVILPSLEKVKDFKHISQNEHIYEWIHRTELRFECFERKKSVKILKLF